MWRSLVARTAGGREVAGSSPVIPTIRYYVFMNQRIAVRAIIKQEENVLLLRRATGRETILGLFELPGGRIAYGEQPEDALRRYLHEDVGLHINKADLFDVVTYIDKDDRDIQYAVITYTVAIAEDHHELKLGKNYDQYIWIPLVDIQQNTLTDLTQLLLGIVHQEEITDKTLSATDSGDDRSLVFDAVIYADGGSRGNPGPSASGYVIMDKNQMVLAQGGEYLGITTNNQAEYHGVRLALEKAIELQLRSIEFRLDSMLVVNQMNGIYTIKNRDLWPINERIRDLITHFDKVTFQHVPREMNQMADGEVNKVLDAHRSPEDTV